VDHRAHQTRAGRQHVGWVDAQSGEPVREQDGQGPLRGRAAGRRGHPHRRPRGAERLRPAPAHRLGRRRARAATSCSPCPDKPEGQAFVEPPLARAPASFSTPRRTAFSSSGKKGSVVKVARAARLNRYVAGQVPKGWDPVRYGIPKDLAEQVDRTTLYNLVATVEAFLSAGLEPEELYRVPPPVGRRQHAGRRHRRHAEAQASLPRPPPRPTAPGRHAAGDAHQRHRRLGGADLVGSYGPMVHPVGACATAAVSLEEAVDKVLGGKAAFIVAGGFDDYGEEGALGFADMAATCDTDDMLARSIPPREMSRPNDRRRRGFVEAQGGGTVLVCRGDLAVRMGLPIYAVVALARSPTATASTAASPRPGPGVMAVAAERRPRDGRARRGAQLCDLPARVASEWSASRRSSPASCGPPSARAGGGPRGRERRRLFHDSTRGTSASRRCAARWRSSASAPTTWRRRGSTTPPPTPTTPTRTAPTTASSAGSAASRATPWWWSRRRR
jgi:3-oxoacyl-(acyl-carrier-protein) synthase